jgi:hypothetical protein
MADFLSQTFNNRQNDAHNDLFRFSEEAVDGFHKVFSEIVDAWSTTLEQHCRMTEELFKNTGGAERPWNRKERGSERVLISTLATAIARHYPQALIVEELPVPKGISSDGRSDLWCHLPCDHQPYSFYLEAKMTGAPRRTLADLEDIFFSHKNSIITRAFRDYQKSHGKLGDVNTKIVTGSPYRSFRQHPHHLVALSVGTFLTKEEAVFDVGSLANSAKDYFQSKQPIHIHKEQNPLQRNLGRLPTTGIAANFRGSGDNGLMAAFSLMGASQK